MSYTKSTKIPTPQHVTEEVFNDYVEGYTNHFAKILTPELMIAHRKGCYATVINGTFRGNTLEESLGTDNAKVATERILNTIASRYSAVSKFNVVD